MPKTPQTVFDNEFLREHFLNSKCDLDNKMLGTHDWAELDKLGYVVRCSEHANG